MRNCIALVYDQQLRDWKKIEAKFHQFSLDEGDNGSYSCAILEDKSGQVWTTSAWKIKFTDTMSDDEMEKQLKKGVV